MSATPAVKAIIWDLDDTLWHGSLAEGDQLAPRESLIKLIAELDRSGIIQSVSSKNDPDKARATLQQLGIADYFVFSRIDFLPKGQNIKAIIEDLQLRAANVLFVDDHPGNREEARYYNPALQVADPLDPAFETFLHTLIKPSGEHSRLTFYKLLEQKQRARQHFDDNAAFLNDSAIVVNLLRNPADMTFLDRITELANRSNQLNFTQSRFPDEQSVSDYFDGPDSLHRHHGAVFAHDKFGHYGLVGFYAFDERKGRRQLEHFYFSCRILNMGIERAIYGHLREHYRLAEFAPMEDRTAPAHHIELREGLDTKTRHFVANELSPRAHYPTAIIAGCSSGIIAHYLSPAMRPACFLNFHLAQPALEASNFDHLIYALYSDYITKGWSRYKLFSYRRFRQQLEALARETRDKRVTLLLASEKFSMPPKAFGKKVEDAVLHGKSLQRMRRCNAIARVIAAQHAHISTVDMGEFVLKPEEQIDPRHFERVVFQRMAQTLA
ncbi:MAG: HAD-IIIC family phosphatase [Oleiphilaceae bacterium]|nr:HAD-IIIC family phosphatase [Oleiphilaceae bacterium]